MFNTGLAQLVEHWSPKPGVRSSSLLTRAKPDFLVGFFCIFKLWRGDRVADCASLESLCTRKGTAGSNPALSAYARRSSSLRSRAFLFYLILIFKRYNLLRLQLRKSAYFLTEKGCSYGGLSYLIQSEYPLNHFLFIITPLTI